jgi:D-alanyl-D-alanine carboxypeptidase
VSTRRSILKTGTGALLALAAGGSGALSAPARPASAAPDPAYERPDLQAALDQIVATAASGALAEFRDGPRVWRGVSGVAELGTARPVPVNGRFRIASVTKTYVATVVLQLVGEGRLGLDDTLDRWLPGIVPNSDRITVRQLLQHTSGVYDYTNRLSELFPNTDALLRQRYRHWSLNDLIALTAGQPPAFEPGTSSSYSNTNYILLGMLVGRITGRSYRTEIARRILLPLRLSDTVLPGDDPQIAGAHPHGYLPVERDGTTTPVDITAFNMTIASSAGEIISTPADVTRFFRALMTGRLLRPAMLDAMLADPVDRYGLGIEQIQISRDVTLWGKGGNFFGFDTIVVTTADGQRQLALFVNPWGGADDGEPMNNLLATAFPG